MTNLLINTDKQRDREAPTFANINLLGKCNVRCYFCLGEDIRDELAPHDQRKVHFSEWANFEPFLDRCKCDGIKKIYVTGQNTDSLLYQYIDELIAHIQGSGFRVGLRTNGYEAPGLLDTINRCNCSVGYSIHSLRTTTLRMIMGRRRHPDWETIIPNTEHPRVSIVLNRCNRFEFWELLRYIKQFPNVKYVQVRRVSTDTRVEELVPDMIAYEEVYTQVRQIFPIKEQLWGDADVFDIYGMDVVFWRTVKTTINSYNYFTDGTFSDLYFVVEGYLKNQENQ
jgi:molybdenum cofactor biosynthesis enzyme MoaA